jgi:hypothetical protein
MNTPAHSVVPYTNDPAHDGLSLTLSELVRLTGIRPMVLQRLASFAVIESYADRGGTLRFPVSELPRLARGIRLRRDLGVGVSSLGLVLDLLERVDALESELGRLKTRF